MEIIVKEVGEKKDLALGFKYAAEQGKVAQSQEASAAVLVFGPGVGKIDMESFYAARRQHCQQRFSASLENRCVVQVPCLDLVPGFEAAFSFCLYADEKSLWFCQAILFKKVAVAAAYFDFQRNPCRKLLKEFRYVVEREKLQLSLRLFTGVVDPDTSAFELGTGNSLYRFFGQSGGDIDK